MACPKATATTQFQTGPMQKCRSNISVSTFLREAGKTGFLWMSSQSLKVGSNSQIIKYYMGKNFLSIG